MFFNLRRIKNSLKAYDDTDLTPEQVQKVSTELGVSGKEVISMNRRMMLGGDASLNVMVGESGEDQWQDLLADDQPLPDELIASAQKRKFRRDMLFEALDRLSERERDILVHRRLVDEPKTLEDLSLVYNVSRERIRQIEVRALEKVNLAVLQKAGERLPAKSRAGV
ncbi:sigma factor-like helix-turn-helix DNA-binding protein [Novosphingobium sp. P6W]|uniref:sigma factor-like helix-turn-helix DNA-binding protein n=1 Tax=Novosphingobium sp. P6W TaxID=1609758 RepID=UPI000AF9F4A8